MQTEFKIQNGIGLIQLTGDLNVVQVDGFRQKYNDWLMANSAVKNVVVDLSATTLIDSAGLGVLISLLKQVSERGGDLTLCGMQRRVRMVFEITRTQRIFSIYDNVEEAVRAFS